MWERHLQLSDKERNAPHLWTDNHTFHKTQMIETIKKISNSRPLVPLFLIYACQIYFRGPQKSARIILMITRSNSLLFKPWKFHKPAASGHWTVVLAVWAPGARVAEHGGFYISLHSMLSCSSHEIHIHKYDATFACFPLLLLFLLHTTWGWFIVCCELR